MTGRGKSSRQRSPDTAALTPLTAAAHLHPQLHSTAKWTSADLLNCRGRPLQLNTETETHSPAQPSHLHINEEFSCPIFGSCC